MPNLGFTAENRALLTMKFGVAIEHTLTTSNPILSPSRSESSHKRSQSHCLPCFSNVWI